jgi:hypothetical protein
MVRFVGAFGALGAAALAVLLAGRSASAHEQPCDFLTGGGFIFTTGGGTHETAKGTLAIGGGCKHGSPTWGHLEYHDHGNGLNAHWTSITAYMKEGDPSQTFDPKTGQPTGTRLVCGTARTNLYGDTDFIVRTTDNGEPGTADEFDIRLSKSGVIVYSTEAEPNSPHKLGDGEGGGGNIQLHKPNRSTNGEFGGDCPAREAVFP